MISAGYFQLCAGQDAGNEAAVHAMRAIYDDPSPEAVLLVDVSNSFNNLNRQVALLNIQTLCPSLVTVLINTYREDVPLFIDNHCIYSSEGTTQGDPLAMTMYSIGITPLIKDLQGPHIRQVWFDDDATAGGSLTGLHEWWSGLQSLGPSYGYFVNAYKTWLSVKPEYLDVACELFKNTSIGITSEGRHYLGASIGSREFTTDYVNEKVKPCIASLLTLSKIGKSHPHVAYCAYMVWRINGHIFFERFLICLNPWKMPFSIILFLPWWVNLLVMWNVLCSLGISNPQALSDSEFTASATVTLPLVDCIIHQKSTFNAEITACQRQAETTIVAIKWELQSTKASELKSILPADLQQILSYATEPGASSWLTTFPVHEHGFALYKGAFRDAICLWYGWHPFGLPSTCAYSKNFTVEYAMNCPTGGFPTMWHNELHDFIASLLSKVCHNVCVEPHLQLLTGETFPLAFENVDDGARLDVASAGWFLGYFIDVKVFNPNVPSYKASSLFSLYH